MGTDRDDVDERIMDAALERILQVGIRRASLDDIARRAGLNRITIYRRFAGKDNLVEATLARETRRMLAEVTTVVTTTEGVDAQIEAAVLYVLRTTRSHPLVTQLLNVAPDEAMSFYTVRGEEMIRQGVDYIVAVLELTRQRGLIDDYDPRPVAELLARLAHSLFLTPGGGVDFKDHDRAREFVRAAVVPLVKHGIGPKETTDEFTRPASSSRDAP
ncbi:TetR/AcrR family transcriptional regulator [Nocardia sp. BMG111209]|uniref:TetR/AcrR family transcriptional regulator n=1 Tax=Nocardia sp. BMG111209 TaxID=1160137 RepID=UPI000372A8B5|nr:TetR/AcrR family transcriptional regulator [Nocardia sp. BMG111209]